MSIVRMRKMFRKPIKVKAGKRRLHLPSTMGIVFGLLVIIFIIGAFSSFGGPQGSGGGGEEGGPRRVSKVMARVGNESIGREAFEAQVAQRLQMMPGGDRVSMLAQLRYSVLNQTIQALLLQEAARTEGIKVSNADLKAEVEQRVQQSISTRWPDEKSLFRYLKQKNLSRAQLVDQIRTQDFSDLDPLREDLMVKKLQEKIEGAGVQNLSEDQIKEQYTEVHAVHILIDPKRIAEAAKAPAAPGQPAPTTPALTAEQADQQAQQKTKELLKQLQGGADFAKLAKENSHDPGSAAQGGDLSWFKRGQMVPEFDQAVFALQPGQLSNVVKSDFGYHIIKLLEKRSSLPKDYEQNKQLYRTQVESDLKNQAWQKYQAGLEKKTPVRILDSEMLAIKMLIEGRTEEGKTLLAQAAQDDPTNMTARWELAQLTMREQNWKAAQAFLEEITKGERSASDPEVWQALAEAYEKQGNSQQAMEAYQAASDRAYAPDFRNYSLHTALKEKFTQLKRNDLVQVEQKWLDDFKKQQEESGGLGAMGLGGMGGPGGPITIPPPG